jgi:hypothetical protein
MNLLGGFFVVVLMFGFASVAAVEFAGKFVWERMVAMWYDELDPELTYERLESWPCMSPEATAAAATEAIVRGASRIRLSGGALQIATICLVGTSVGCASAMLFGI